VPVTISQVVDGVANVISCKNVHAYFSVNNRVVVAVPRAAFLIAMVGFVFWGGGFVCADDVVFDVPGTVKCYLLSESITTSGQVDPAGPEVANLATNLSQAATGPSGSHAIASFAGTAGQKHPRVTLATASHSSGLARLLADRSPTQAGGQGTEGSLSRRYAVQAVSQTKRYLIPIDVTVLFADADRVESVMFEIIPQSHRWQIVDYAPQNQSMTNFEGPISLETKKDESGGVIGDLKAGIPGYADLSLHVDGGKKQNSLSRQQLKAPQTQVVTSGLSQRGSGAFFKLQASREFVIEGGHRLELIFDAPATWRGDVIQVHCRAKTTDSMVVKDFLVAAYIDGDAQSGYLAQHLANADRMATSLLNRFQVTYKKPSGMLEDLEALLNRRSEKDVLQPSQIQNAMIWATDLRQVKGSEQFPAKIKTALEQLIEAKRAMLTLSR